MTTDLKKLQEFYSTQVDRGVYEEFGGRTNLGAVELLMQPRLVRPPTYGTH